MKKCAAPVLLMVKPLFKCSLIIPLNSLFLLTLSLDWVTKSTKTSPYPPKCNAEPTSASKCLAVLCHAEA